MTYATVMVSLAVNQPNEARLEVAGQLAERFDADLIGIAAAQFTPPLYFADGEPAQALIEEGEASIKHRLAEVELQFRAANKNRAQTLDWRCAIDFPARYVLQESRSADIIVSGGQSPAFSDSFTLASPKDLVLQAGRPLLLVPDGANWLDLRSVVVAWKDTGEARRAIVDALPLLRKAKEVTVAAIPEPATGRLATISRVRDVIGWLLRHRIVASERVPEVNERDSAAVQLDQIAGNVGANLIIAGAYGHSRFRELILGGVTQHLLTQTNRCALLSH
jgi:nucleotide-binding universal stress UspA family protein